jgi:hypothetical protein
VHQAVAIMQQLDAHQHTEFSFLSASSIANFSLQKCLNALARLFQLIILLYKPMPMSALA